MIILDNPKEKKCFFREVWIEKERKEVGTNESEKNRREENNLHDIDGSNFIY